MKERIYLPCLEIILWNTFKELVYISLYILLKENLNISA